MLKLILKDLKVNFKILKYKDTRSMLTFVYLFHLNNLLNFKYL